MLKTAIARIAEIAAVAVRTVRAFADNARPLLRGFAGASAFVVMTVAVAGCGGGSEAVREEAPAVREEAPAPKPPLFALIEDYNNEGSYEEAARLIAEGADVNARDENDDTPLHAAARREFRDVDSQKKIRRIILLLLENGAEIDAINWSNHDTPLELAVRWAWEGIDTALGYGALDHMRDNVWDIPTLLLEKGADFERFELDLKNHRFRRVYRYGFIMPLLHILARVDAHETAALLLEKGANVNKKNDKGMTPLHLAASGNATVAAELLLEKGADVNAQTVENGWVAPLHLAVKWRARGMVRLLLRKGEDVNVKDEDEWTPLHYAAHRNDYETVLLLLENGADVNAEDSDGYTPMVQAHQARTHSGDESYRILKRHGGRCVESGKRC